MPLIKIRTNDDQILEVDVEIAKCSETIMAMLENQLEDVISLSKVSSVVLNLVIEWAVYHKDKPLPPGFDETRKCDDVPQWDANFLRKIDKETLLELNTAAMYLNVKGLKGVVGKTIAKMLKNKSAKEVKEILNIETDRTPEGKEQALLDLQLGLEMMASMKKPSQP